MIHARPRATGAAVPGGAPVGHVAELPALESAALAVLRLRVAGHGAEVAAMFRSVLGGADGAAAMQALEDLAALLARAARRPIAWHHPRCACYGGDESAVIRLVSEAARGEEDEAALIALHLAPCIAAELLCRRAAWFGAALGPVAECAAAASAWAGAPPPTRH